MPWSFVGKIQIPSTKLQLNLKFQFFNHQNLPSKDIVLNFGYWNFTKSMKTQQRKYPPGITKYGTFGCGYLLTG
jgi:hypothetical protein